MNVCWKYGKQKGWLLYTTLCCLPRVLLQPDLVKTSYNLALACFWFTKGCISPRLARLRFSLWHKLPYSSIFPLQMRLANTDTHTHTHHTHTHTHKARGTLHLKPVLKTFWVAPLSYFKQSNDRDRSDHRRLKNRLLIPCRSLGYPLRTYGKSKCSRDVVTSVKSAPTFEIRLKKNEKGQLKKTLGHGNWFPNWSLLSQTDRVCVQRVQK